MTISYRLGLDIGTNSIGWCAVALDAEGRPSGVLDAGVRILTPNDEAGRNPKSKASLAANRRLARGARRRRDRFLRRQKRLMTLLTEAGLMPADRAERKCLEKLDPYWLRKTALDRRIELHEIGRALFHLNQRRGFRSNRIADSDNDKKSAMKQGAAQLTAAIGQPGQPRTLGEFLANRHRRDRFGRRDGSGAAPEPVRFRPTSQGSKNLYDFYPTRELAEAEIDRIWTSQQRYHDEALTENLRETIKAAIIDQRPLKPQIVGRCTLMPDKHIVSPCGFPIDLGERAPKAHPLFQRFRILQDVCQLRIVRPGARERYLTLAERDAVASALMHRSGVAPFDKLRSALKLRDDERLNYERTDRKGFQPDQTAAKLGSKNHFGKEWRSSSRELQIEVVERLLAVQNEDEMRHWLRQTFGLHPDTAECIAEARLPQGHGQFGRAALGELVRIMESEGVEATSPVTGEVYRRPLTYNEAVERLGKHHSDLRPDRLPFLPYYGKAMARHVVSRPNAPEGSQERIGRVPNPTVHIGLNQLRKIVNLLIETCGPPQEIAVELARELKLNKKRKDEVNKLNNENRKANDEIREELKRLGYNAESHDNRLRLRLHRELPPAERVCVYSGTPISKQMLFGGGVEIDHILPHSRTLDDSFANKVLCTKQANQEKGNRAPAEAWKGDRLQGIAERAERLFKNKAWRFAPDAMERFEERGGIAARHLTDTQHMSRLAKTYLEHVCDRVDASPGRLTAMLRGKWGLNSLLPDHNYANVNQPKNRKDHRHHAIDAFVLACTDRGLLNRIARESGRAEELDINRLFPKDSFPMPFDGYREALQNRLNTMIVSHKPDHGIPPGAQDDVRVTSGALLEGSAYGFVDSEIDGKPYNLVYRVPIHQVTDSIIEGKKGRIVRDECLRQALRKVRDDAKRAGQQLDEALSEYGRHHNIHRIRILKTDQSVKIVKHGNGFRKAYSAGDNHRIEIYEMPDGSWRGEGVTVFDANRPGFRPEWCMEHPNAKLVMRLHKGDLIEADLGDGREIYRVCRLVPSNDLLWLAPHNEAGSLEKRYKDEDDPFRYKWPAYPRLQQAGARRVRVDPLGRVAYAKERP